MALKYGPQYLQYSFKQYMELLMKSNSNILFVKYEEMVTNFDSWLKKVSQHLEVNLSGAEKTVYTHKPISGLTRKTFIPIKGPFNQTIIKNT